MNVLIPPPSYEFVELPSYTQDTNASSSFPASPSINANQEYRYKNDHLILCLGPKRLGIFRPTYGWNDDISGYVLVRSKLNKVKSIRLHIEGILTAGVSERGFLVDQKRIPILKASQTLLETPEGEEDVTCLKNARYPFTFPLPSYVTGGSESLPATSSVIHMGLTVNITYFIKVEMIRNGKLRANERLGTFFNYLPRTFTPLLGQFRVGSSFDDEKLEQFRFSTLAEWRSFRVLPKVASACHNVDGMLPPCLLQVSLHLQKPLVYASNCAFPFRMELVSSDNDPFLSLFSDSKVDLIRVTTITIDNRWTTVETVVGQGDIKRVEETPRQRLMYGYVTCSNHGESSWHCAGHIDVKHLLRVKLSPKTDSPSLSKSLPTFSHYVSIGMRTHYLDQADASEARLPAFSRLPRQFSGLTV